ncbi:lipoprotein [Pseudodesulfovibrio nedwellii]|uniref:Lipoprotein n=1 Tax=Pseudodesulfovibrio nedwellii TaxID=2973072 RepID=A0ABN6S5C1_9BACT|nr:patatin-like phospholipase family protein [Pseudodesulfovibrio nedwellii]BDQ38415.1 lipoprotein [Pseudodesulfovibrio nedwellii]
MKVTRTNHILHFTALLCLALILAGCSGKRSPMPEGLLHDGQLPNYKYIRFYGDSAPEKAAMRLLLAQWAAQEAATGNTGNFTVLSLSGGGADGAFGAGFLTGWTSRGDRPNFTFVTGVSTGALIAPFAFLGPEYDATLKLLYTTFSTINLVKARPIGSALVGDGLFNVNSFRRALKTYVNTKIINKIAAEHRKGRRLFVGTTNLDEMRPVYWNIGAIAQFQTKKAHQLIRDVILASASVPVAFPPMYFSLEIDGKKYEEMHVDGGVTNQVFAYPPSVHMKKNLDKLGISRKIILYVIRNDALTTKPIQVNPNLGDIAARSLTGLIRNQGIGDLYRIFYVAERDGADFNLAFIPPTFQADSNELFDPNYMSKLFKVGQDMAKSTTPWHKTPPYDLNPQQ